VVQQEALTRLLVEKEALTREGLLNTIKAINEEINKHCFLHQRKNYSIKEESR
jgi:hypothetical protein